MKRLLLKSARLKTLLLRRQPPAYPMTFLPDGFSVRHIGNTGISIVDNFCTKSEAQYMIEKARPLLTRSRVLGRGGIDPSVSGVRTSNSATILSHNETDTNLLPLLRRCEMLTGLPYSYVEAIFIHQYAGDGYYQAHMDYVSEKYPALDRLYSILVYLSDLDEEQGGKTWFPRLKVAMSPKLGRAAFWVNRNADNSYRNETLHEALPVIGRDTEKWVAQIFTRSYKIVGHLEADPTTQHLAPGKALEGLETLPDGAAFMAVNPHKAAVI